MRFVDEIEIILASGDGGAGCVSFHRAKHEPRGGPDGGNGGDGGALIVRATSNRNTLVDFRRNKRYAAQSGRQGQGKNMFGAKGDDLVLLVPIGTALHHQTTGELVADLDTDGAEWRLDGGMGGAGNAVFASSTNRTPRYAQPGTPGIEVPIRLELKLIADVGLLGFPNAGKSTFISAVTHSKSAIGAHPFTTLTPHLGVVKLGEGNSMVLADMPGLIEGAADGQGLGHRFLKHVERCVLYLHLVSPDDFDGTPVERFRKLNQELSSYGDHLARRPQIVVLTKADLLDEAQTTRIVDDLRAASGSRVFVVSAVSREGVVELMGAVWAALNQLRETPASDGASS